MSAAWQMREFTSWGRVRRVPHTVARPRHLDEVATLLTGRGERQVLAVGLGRSYGDTIVNADGCLIDMSGCSRIRRFDRETGILRAEAGLSVDEALRVIVPAGWFFPTTPGTRFVTLGGAVANDVHGKNHQTAGTFGCSVRRLGLLRSDGSEHELDADTGNDLFRATIGGLGLTGIVTWVELDLARVPSTHIDVERIPFADVSGFFRLAAEAKASHEHTVAWIDCANGGKALGRGIFQRANWTQTGGRDLHHEKLKASMPLELPSFALSGITVRAFNALYWRLQKSGPARAVQHYDPFLFPLDTIGHWNRLYGRRGFYQYQCVVPPRHAEDVVIEIVRQIARAGAGSFLAVLKSLGPRTSPGFMSFPHEGATLALDFPNRGAHTLELFARLDAVVAEAGGRLYAAKDGRMPAAMFQTGYSEHFSRFRSEIDPAFSSEFWQRVSA